MASGCLPVVSGRVGRVGAIASGCLPVVSGRE